MKKKGEISWNFAKKKVKKERKCRIKNKIEQIFHKSGKEKK